MVKLFGDKNYIGKNFFQRLFIDGIQLMTKLNGNIKGALMSTFTETCFNLVVYAFAY